MIKFTDLRVTKDGKQLIIGAKVKEDSYYNDVYIDKVIIDTEETFSPTGPSSQGIEINIHEEKKEEVTFTGKLYNGEFYYFVDGHADLDRGPFPHIKWGYYTDIDGDVGILYIWDGTQYIQVDPNAEEKEAIYPKEIYLTLDKTDLANITVDNHLFYIYIIAGGAPESDCPCGMDNQTTLGVTMYTGHYYDDFMNYIKELGDDCNIPQGLIDYILRYKVLVNSIDTGHYTEANKFYSKWFKEGYSIPMSKYNCGCYG